MSVDLNFWKSRNGIYLDNAMVYRKACCDKEEVEGLEALPIDVILKEIAMAFHEWNSLTPFNYEKEGYGSFQISTTPQMVRFDCYSMEQADMKRFSSIMSKFECSLYDPQQGVRFDKIIAFLIDEACEYEMEVKQELSHWLPHLEIITQAVSWGKYVELSKMHSHIEYNVVIHRAKTLTKVTSFMRIGSIWANRPCQCKTAQLADKDKEHQILGELLHKSIVRVVNDFLKQTYYE